jgi:hypothetical protein
LPLHAAINTLFSSTKGACSEISLPEFSNQVKNVKERNFPPSSQCGYTGSTPRQSKRRFIMDKKALGHLPENISVFPVSDNPSLLHIRITA